MRKIAGPDFNFSSDEDVVKFEYMVSAQSLIGPISDISTSTQITQLIQCQPNSWIILEITHMSGYCIRETEMTRFSDKVSKTFRV